MSKLCILNISGGVANTLNCQTVGHELNFASRPYWKTDFNYLADQPKLCTN